MTTSTENDNPAETSVERRQEAVAEAEEILRDLPQMKPAAAFTQRDKGSLTKLANRMRSHVSDDGVIDVEDPETVDAAMDFFADLDDFFAGLAHDEQAYRAWFASILKDSETALGALLARYQEQLGE